MLAELEKTFGAHLEQMTKVSGPPPGIRDGGGGEMWFAKPRLQAGWVGNSSTLWFILLHLARGRGKDNQVHETVVSSAVEIISRERNPRHSTQCEGKNGKLSKSISWSAGKGKGKGGKGDGTANGNPQVPRVSTVHTKVGVRNLVYLVLKNEIGDTSKTQETPQMYFHCQFWAW